MRRELFPKRRELLTIHSARTSWRFARRKLATLSEPAQVPFYRRVANSKRSGCFVNAEVALPYSFDDSFS